ncbi:CPBP family glutamic-type intramembrane protease [Planctomonas psychrotolerans]|uniref:CPBP family glutamic-type intramembrane protease n=1 Tax=Planctomonas psychrotolerans TaxID=2528712 RepID=UPI0012388CD7|nr:CPBP family glutamic-type intramembrane protease [Planctomonas psychrotolerans]
MTATPVHSPNTLGRPRASVKLVPAILLSASGVLLFGIGSDVLGYPALALALGIAWLIDRPLFRDMLLIAAGMLIISAIPLDADISVGNMIQMGSALALAVIVPYVVSRWVYRDHAVRFPINTGQRWTRIERLYLVFIVILGWAILPFYMINTGVYENWPAVSEPFEMTRLFIGVNAVGIWDELFFVCTTFTLLRRHFPDWQANLLQAFIFSSFLWEIGYHAWGPLLTFPFALLQGYTFKITKSLTYVVCVHLLFDLVLFLVLVHAHNREWLNIFIY